MAYTGERGEAQKPLRTTALFLLGAVAILLIGASRTFVTQFLSARVPSESSQMAMLRLQYELFGPTIFAVCAVCHSWLEGDDASPSQLRRPARLSFWLMFVGFNVAFLPTSWRGARPALITDPGVLISGQNGAIPIAGAMIFIGGLMICVWTLSRFPRCSLP